MELRHLRYFVAVAEELHFGRAATRLRIAQPPLSRQIRDLERTVGTPLFARVARGVELTAAGRAFLPEARLTLAQAERAQRTARRAAEGEIGRIRVGFVETATYSGILPDVLGFFRLHLPTVGLSLFEMSSQQQIDAFREGRIDVGLLYAPPADAERWLHVEAVFADPLVLAVPEEHAVAARSARSRPALREVAGDPFVFFPRPVNPALHDDVVSHCRRDGFSPRVVQEATAWHTFVGLVAAGVGVSFVPRSLARVARTGVAFRTPRDFPVALTLHAVWRRGDRSPVRERFVTTLRTVARASQRGRR